MNLDEHLSAKGKELRDRTQAFMNKIEPELLDYVESSEFPFKMMD